jgi:chromosomal replication initiator protein
MTGAKERITIADIQHHICRQYGLTRDELLSHHRSAKYVGPRQLAMYISVRRTQLSLTVVGRHFNRDHTTVMHAERKVTARINREPKFSIEVAALEANIVTAMETSNV